MNIFTNTYIHYISTCFSSLTDNPYTSALLNGKTVSELDSLQYSNKTFFIAINLRTFPN